ncbi:MAG: 4Fe-4S cluster-binding domain-containing protein [Bifidobacterium sp.]|jgi:uncharacterized protein|nr:4Fe-4S cluster-binding domain-containing protein [Bifidobacterium sp.]
MYRRSKYVAISSNTYSKDGDTYKLVYAMTGPRLFVLSREVADSLARNDINHLSSDMTKSLLENGLLRTDSSRDEIAQAQEYLCQSGSDDTHRSFILMPTSLCNMCCAYCGQGTCPLRFTKSTDETVNKRVIGAINDPQTTRVDVRWYGGEPMMAYHHILDMSHRYISAAHDSGTEYHSIMSTNGSLITYDRLEKLYEQAALRAINVTIDGYGNHHNNSRKMRSGRPTYQHIMNWLQESTSPEKALSNLDILNRVNVTKDNAESIPKLLNDIVGRNIQQGRTHLQLMPVYNWGHDNSEYKVEQDRLDTMMVTWLDLAVSLGIHTNVLPLHRKTVLCPAVSKHEEIIDSNGNVFSCTEFPLVKQYENNNRLASITI